MPAERGLSVPRHALGRRGQEVGAWYRALSAVRRQAAPVRGLARETPRERLESARSRRLVDTAQAVALRSPRASRESAAGILSANPASSWTESIFAIRRSSPRDARPKR